MPAIDEDEDEDEPHDEQAVAVVAAQMAVHAVCTALVVGSLIEI